MDTEFPSVAVKVINKEKVMKVVKNPSSSHKPQWRTSLIWSDSKPKLKSAIDGPSEFPDEFVEAIEKTESDEICKEFGVCERKEIWRQSGSGQICSRTGSEILHILKAHGLAPEIPEDLYHLIKGVCFNNG
ncbi:hypothetical protein U1Q18_021186 [Sarracenia purpurea var. burkii]